MVLNRILMPLFTALAIATIAVMPAQAQHEHNALEAASVEAPVPAADAHVGHNMSADHHAAEPMPVDYHGDAAMPARARRQHNGPETEPVEAPAATAEVPVGHDMSADHHATEPIVMDHHGEAVTPRTGIARLIDWLGRFHPMLVHFPLALLPMAFIAILVARRRPEWTHTAHILVVTAGLAVIPAALFGWFAGGFALAGVDSLLVVHRWLGTAIAVAGAGLALIVWRGRVQISHPIALVTLIAINIALIVQGWYGGALVHGADHLAWQETENE